MSKPLFTEKRVDLKFTGTISTPPAEFTETELAESDLPNGITIEFLSAESGYAYTVTVLDVVHAERLDDSSWQVTYELLKFDDGTVAEIDLQAAFSVTEIAT